MKNILTGPALLLILSSLVYAQTTEPKSSPATADETAIHELEDKFAVAYGHNDADALDAL